MSTPRTQGGSHYPQQSQPGPTSPYGPVAGYGAPPPFAHSGARERLRPVGPLLMILGAIAAIIALFLPWNYDLVQVDAPEGGFTYENGEAWNAFDQIGVNQDAGRSYGTLMLIAIILALACCVAVFISALGTLLARPRGKGLGVLGIIAAVLGLIGTLGVLLGYVVLGATHEGAIGMWIYGLSFIPVLIGAIGLLSKKY